MTLGVTALVSSRTFFALLRDPEGPNLLIVVVLAAFIYFLSFLIYSSNLSKQGYGKLGLAILTQIAAVVICYLLLN